MSASVEKCFEDAEESGCLQILHKGLKQFPVCVDAYDLLDVTTVDISKNRFVELPQEVLSFVMMESLNSSYNFLKTLPDLSHLSALTVLDVRPALSSNFDISELFAENFTTLDTLLLYINHTARQNQLQSFPIHLCSLPLKILNASHNRITVLPSEVGLLSKLQLLDLSCNELTNLPSTMGDLLALGSLNIRRNQVVALPDELSKLKNLTKLNFSCNKVSTIPPAFRLISSLIELDLTNNPLLSPPAHICLKGRRHITKYLGLAAEQQEKRWTLMKENQIMRSPSSSSLSSNSPTDLQADVDYESRERRGTIKYEEEEEGVEVVLPSEEPDEKPSLPKQNIAISQQNGEAASSDSKSEESHQQEKASELRRSSPSIDKPKVPKKPTSARSSFNEKHRINQEKGKLTPQPYKSRLPSTQSSTSGRLWSGSESSEGSLDRNAVRSLGSQLKSNDDESNNSQQQGPCIEKASERMDDLAARKEQLLKNKEEILKSKQRLELIKSKSLTREGNTAATEINTPSPDLDESDSLFEGISKRNPHKPQKAKWLHQDKVINFTMRRVFDSAKEEFELLEKLRESIETRLRIKLPDDLPASLSDGIVLCHLVNHLRKSTIPIIHVPSSGVPKLTMPKCQMNVDAFLDACRRAGVTKEDMCTAPDILEEKSPTRLCRTVHALLLAMGDIPPEIVIAQEISLQSPR